MASTLFSTLKSSQCSSALQQARAMSAAVAPSMYVGAQLPMLLVKPGSKSHAEELMNSSKEEQEAGKDPFKSLPFRKLADFLGDALFPSIEEMREQEAKRKKLTKEAEVYQPPPIPSIFPITRWASTNEKFRATLVVTEATTVKPRLSWYHPDDTLVPRDWFKKGLLEDMKYYRPFC